MDQLLNKKYVAASVDRLESERAVLILDDGQKLDWPASELPADVSEGARVKLVLLSAKTEQEAREKMAKDILNEILKTD